MIIARVLKACLLVEFWLFSGRALDLDLLIQLLLSLTDDSDTVIEQNPLYICLV